MVCCAGCSAGCGWRRKAVSPERLLNLAAREEIELWGVRHRGEAPVRLLSGKTIPAASRACPQGGNADACDRKARRALLGARYRERAGVAVGLAAFLLVLQLFAQRTWVIEVRGNDKVKSEDILAVMETLGVREGRNLGIWTSPPCSSRR